MSEMTSPGPIAEVRFTCEWCGGTFDYTPGLIGDDVGVRISVQREGDRCVRHDARVVDLRGVQPTACALFEGLASGPCVVCGLARDEHRSHA